MRRVGERGSESLEFMAILPLLLIVAALLWQGMVLIGEQSEAEADARALARATALCQRPMPQLGDVDDQAGTGAVAARDDDPSASLVGWTVKLPLRSVVKDVNLGIGPIAATVHFRQEPCS